MSGHRPPLISFPAGVAGRRPVALLLPGGGYRRHSPVESEPVARWLNSLGVDVVLVHYRVAPDRHPAALDDVRAVLRDVRSGAVPGIGPGPVGVVGFSAGGHLAALACTGGESAERPDFAILGYPVISFVHDPEPASVSRLLGPDPDLAARRRCSAELLAAPDCPPTFCWHTADDRGVPVAHSLRYVDALARQGVPCELHVFARGGHGLGLAHGSGPAARWPELCARWLDGLESIRRCRSSISG